MTHYRIVNATGQQLAIYAHHDTLQVFSGGAYRFNRRPGAVPRFVIPASESVLRPKVNDNEPYVGYDSDYIFHFTAADGSEQEATLSTGQVGVEIPWMGDPADPFLGEMELVCIVPLEYAILDQWHRACRPQLFVPFGPVLDEGVIVGYLGVAPVHVRHELGWKNM